MTMESRASRRMEGEGEEEEDQVRRGKQQGMRREGGVIYLAEEE